MLRSRFVRSFVLVLTTFVAISCADYTPIEPITAPTKAQDGLIGDLLGLVTGLLGSLIKVISFQSDPNGIPVTAIKWAPTHVNQTRSVSGTIGYNGGSPALGRSVVPIQLPHGAPTA